MQLSLKDRILLNEAEKMYEVASNSVDKDFLNVADECIQIANRHLSKISNKYFN